MPNPTDPPRGGFQSGWVGAVLAPALLYGIFRWLWDARGIVPWDMKRALLGVVLGTFGALQIAYWRAVPADARNAWGRGRRLGAAGVVLGFAALTILGARFALPQAAAVVTVAILGGWWGQSDTADQDSPPGTSPTAVPRWLRIWTVGAMVAAAVASATVTLGIDTRVFEPWWQGAASAWNAGQPVEGEARHQVVGLLRVVGLASWAQFTTLAWVAAHSTASGMRTLVRVGSLSILSWFVVDTAASLWHGGSFNVRMINLPTVALTLPPLWLLWRRERR